MRINGRSSMQECFNSPYGCEYFKEYAESVPQKTGDPGLEAGESCKSLSEAARSNKVFIVGGLYNTVFPQIDFALSFILLPILPTRNPVMRVIMIALKMFTHENSYTYMNKQGNTTNRTTLFSS